MSDDPSPFNHIAIRDWFFQHLEVPEELSLPTTTGSGPFEEDEFDEFLIRNDITPLVIDEDTKVLVIGWEFWTSGDLQWAKELCDESTLRVYSQEMYLCYWATHYDPWRAPTDVVQAFYKGHPALEYLREHWPEWVSTFVSRGDSGDFGSPPHELGLLKYMGYHVGKKGMPLATRRAILRNVFEEEHLPEINGPEYMSEWGQPRSLRRLMKMAKSIAAFCRNSKNNPKPAKKAIQDWEADLEWLRNEFYEGRVGWPDSGK